MDSKTFFICVIAVLMITLALPYFADAVMPQANAATWESAGMRADNTLDTVLGGIAPYPHYSPIIILFASVAGGGLMAVAGGTLDKIEGDE